MDRALKPSNGAERRGEKRKSYLPRKREKESKAGWNKRKHNEVNGKGEKKRTVGPRVSTPTRIGMGQQLVTVKQTTCQSKKWAGRFVQEVHVGICSSRCCEVHRCTLWFSNV